MSKSKTMIYKSGKLRGEKIVYVDGVGCCIWYPIPNTSSAILNTLKDNDIDVSDDEESGICFDFNADDIDDMIKLLQKLKEATPDIFIDDSSTCH